VLTLTSHPHRLSPIAIVLVGILSALVLFSASAVSSPSTVSAASFHQARCDGVSLRTKPSTSATRKATVAEGTKFMAVAVISGGSWKVSCDGKTTSGSSWYRISMVNDKTVKARYGVTYVYAAKALLGYASVTRYAKCDGVSLRTKASTSATRKDTVSMGTKMAATGIVTGGSWTATCNGQAVSGDTWYRFSGVDGTSTSSLYDASVVYAASGLVSIVDPGTVPPPPSATPTPTPTPKSNLTEGIDVSHWQGTIDWAKVRAAGKKFAFIKASEHTSFVDGKYQTNRTNAKANGILVGAYHFARPDVGTADAQAEADHFIETADWKSGELRPFLDLEDTGGLSSSELQTWVKAFVQRIYYRTNVRAIIYVSPSFWSTKMGNSTWFAQNGYDVLWIAHWTTASSPTVPADNWGGKSWTFWQYTSDGSVSGISGRVDLDRYKGTDFSRVRIP
jgi:GH25 family lysozyme M1 (1,4-beta-N-acetylmuramidase)